MDISLEIFRIVALCCGALSFICLIVAIFVFIKLDIPYVINDLRGNIKNTSIRRREKENLEKNNNVSYSEEAVPEKEIPLTKNENVDDNKEDDDEQYTKPLFSDNKIFDNFKVVKSIIFVNTREEINLER